MKVTIKDYGLSACVTPLRLFDSLLITKRNTRGNIGEFLKFFEFEIILILIDILLNLPKKVGRQLDEKSVSSRRSILPRK